MSLEGWDTAPGASFSMPSGSKSGATHDGSVLITAEGLFTPPPTATATPTPIPTATGTPTLNPHGNRQLQRNPNE